MPTDPDQSTDLAWEQWGCRDPYFGTITEARFRRTQMTDEAKCEFFRLGDHDAQLVLHRVRQYIDANFSPRAVLDFGCGVGRTLIPFAAFAAQVTGLDVSPSMLQEARRNCDEQGRHNVRLLLSDDELSALSGDFDLIHSSIVFQHIPVARGRAILCRLLKFLRPGGVGAMQVTYARSRYAATYGVAQPEPAAPGRRRAARATHQRRKAAPEPDRPEAEHPDPEMQMNSYNLSEILFCVQQAGVQRVHVDFTDHGGELGVFLFFQKPAGATAQRSL